MKTDLRLAIPVAAAWLTAVLALSAPPVLLPAAIAAWATAAILLAIAFRRPHPIVGVLVLAAACTAVVLTSASARVDDRRPGVLLDAAESGRHVHAEAITTQAVSAGTGSFTVELTGIVIGTTRSAVSVPARVFGTAAERELGIGAAIAVDGTLATTDPADAVAFLVLTDEPPELVRGPPMALDWANDLRTGFRSAVADLPGDGGALLPGLAIGDTSAVGPQLDQAMKDASLSHLTAVSGANCAVVIGLVMVAGARVGLPRTVRIAASVCVLVGFVVLVTPEPSVLRAAVMVGIVLVALARGRPARGIPVMALAVVTLLTIDPWLARQYGFVLSVLATAGLLLLSGPLADAGSRLLPRPVAAAIAIPLAAQLACQPVLLMLAPSISTYGILANILAGPAAPVATVMGLVACLILPFAPPVGTIAGWIAWLPSAWIAAVAEFFAGAPGARIAWPPGPVGILAVAFITAASLIAVLAHRRSLRRAAQLTLAAALILHGGVAVGGAVRTSLTRPGEWQYAGCDIGQGDATLVRSDGRIALIDTGPDPALLTACLDSLGIARIDLLVLSHFDLDHVGGTSAVVGRVDTVLIGPSDGPDADRLTRQLADGGAQLVQAHKGMQGVLGALRWTVLWPRDPLRGTEPGNAASVAMRFDGAGPCPTSCVSAVLLGDLGEEEQLLLLATNQVTRTDVVKVAHHGSSDQSARLYDALDATVALVGVGADNTYGHPTERALDILASTGTVPARTDRNGLILVGAGRDGSVLVWTENGG